MSLRIGECWQVGAWIEHPDVGAIVVTSGELAISLLAPNGFIERTELEARYPEGWRLHPESPVRP